MDTVTINWLVVLIQRQMVKRLRLKIWISVMGHSFMTLKYNTCMWRIIFFFKRAIIKLPNIHKRWKYILRHALVHVFSTKGATLSYFKRIEIILIYYNNDKNSVFMKKNKTFFSATL